MSNASNVLVGVPLKATGGVSIAPTGTALPTDATTGLNAAFKAAGFISDNGLEETVDRKSDTVKAWGGDTVRAVQSEYGVSYKFTFIETLNSDVLKAVYGDSNVTVTAATSTTDTLYAIALNSAVLPKKEFVFEIKDGAARIRIVVPLGQITDVSPVKYDDKDPIAYEVTVTAFPDASSNYAYRYIDDGVHI